MIFIIPNRHNYKVVMRPFKNDKEGNVLQEPKYLHFEDGVYETNDPEVIEFIHKLRNFGIDILEVKEVPSTHGYQGHSVAVHQMNFTKDEVVKQEAIQEAQTKEIEGVKAQVEELSGTVNALVKLLTDKQKKEEQKEEKKRLENEAKEEAKRNKQSEEGVG